MRLRKREQYQRMAQNSLKFTGEWILVNIRLSKGLVSRLGITVSKRYGSAPMRNRFKRVVREAFRLSRSNFGCIVDIVVRPRSKSLEATPKSIQEELTQFIENAKNAHHRGS